MSFATWIRETRLAKGLQVSECAFRAGVGQPTWSEYEGASAQKEWRKTTVTKIANGLGVDKDIALLQAGILPQEEPDLEIARRLGPIVGRAAPAKRGQIVDSLAEMAERMVNLAGDYALGPTEASPKISRKATGKQRHNAVLYRRFGPFPENLLACLPGYCILSSPPIPAG